MHSHPRKVPKIQNNVNEEKNGDITFSYLKIYCKATAIKEA